MNRSIGLLVIVGGLFVALLGLLIYTGALSWSGVCPATFDMKASTSEFMSPSFRCCSCP